MPRLRARVEPLADADAAAYAAFMDARTAETVERIVAIPHEIALVAAEVAELAALVAAEGNPNVRATLRRGCDLAAAAASIAARLVAMNAGEGDDRVRETRELAARASKSIANEVSARDVS